MTEQEPRTALVADLWTVAVGAAQFPGCIVPRLVHVDGAESVEAWRARAVQAVVQPELDRRDAETTDLRRELDRVAAEFEKLLQYAETTRHHQQRHAEAVRELEKLRQFAAGVATILDEMPAGRASAGLCGDVHGRWTCTGMHEVQKPNGSLVNWGETVAAEQQPRVWHAGDHVAWHDQDGDQRHAEVARQEGRAVLIRVGEGVTWCDAGELTEVPAEPGDGA